MIVKLEIERDEVFMSLEKCMNVHIFVFFVCLIQKLGKEKKVGVYDIFVRLITCVSDWCAAPFSNDWETI
jgi:hypothetical protein